MRKTFLTAAPRLVPAIAATVLSTHLACADPGHDCATSQDPQVAIDACSAFLDLPQATTQQQSVAHERRGMAHLRQLHLGSAMQDFDAAISLNASNVSAYAARGRTAELWAMESGGQAALDKAAADYGRAAELMAAATTASSAERDRAAAALGDHRDCDQAKDSSKRVQACGRLIDARDGQATALDAVIYNNRAIGYEKLRSEDKALADLDKAIQLYPQYAFAIADRAYLQRFLGHYDAAASDFSAAAKLVKQAMAQHPDPGLAALAKDLKARAVGSKDEEELERRWAAYLKEIEARNQYQNWPARPYSDLYRARHDQGRL